MVSPNRPTLKQGQSESSGSESSGSESSGSELSVAESSYILDYYVYDINKIKIDMHARTQDFTGPTATFRTKKYLGERRVGGGHPRPLNNYCQIRAIRNIFVMIQTRN